MRGFEFAGSDALRRTDPRTTSLRDPYRGAETAAFDETAILLIDPGPTPARTLAAFRSPPTPEAGGGTPN